MFTMAKIKDRNTINGLSHKSNYLDTHLVHNDYYSESNTVEGEWLGGLCERLGLEGETIGIGDSSFELIRKNINPASGEKLTPRNRIGGIRFYDFQCSAQKSVSVMAVTLGDDRLRVLHRESFGLAMRELEKFASCRDNSRSGILLEPLTTGNVAAAVFHHDASRSLDPQIHTHCVVANATYNAGSRRILALQESSMVRAIRYAGKVYQNHMAVGVRALGYEIEDKINTKGIIEGFEIKGLPEDILKRYSKRRAVIDTEIERFKEFYGRKPTTAEISILVKESRNKKLDKISTKKVLKQQLAQLSVDEKKYLMGLKANSISQTLSGIEVDYYDQSKMDEIIKHSIGHLYSRKSVLKGNQVLAECLNQGLGHIHLESLKNEVMDNRELIKLNDNYKNSFLRSDIGTQTGMNLELWAVEKIKYSKNSFGPINKNFIPFSGVESSKLEVDGKRDYTEQRKAIKEILNTKDKYMSLRGVAGSGKTSTLSELQKGLKYTDFVCLAPQTGGKNILIGEGFKNARTVESFKHNHSGFRKGLIIVDEAGLLSNIDGTSIMKIAEKTDSRVLFIGDTKQHKSVAAGDFLRILETYSDIHQSHLNKIFRQKNDYYKRAASMMSSGDIEGGLYILDKHESLKWVNEGQGKYVKNAVDDYMKFTDDGRNLDKCIFITPTHKEAEKITEALRVELKEKRVVDSDLSFKKEVFKSLNWTAAQKRSVKSYIKGQKILIREDNGSFRKHELLSVDRIIKDKRNINRVLLSNSRMLRISDYKTYEVGETKSIELCRGDKIMSRLGHNDIANGDIFTVRGKDRYGNIATSEGVVIPKGYSSLQYGFVSTSHKRQGSKAPYVVIAAETINKDAMYVAATRGVHECRINVPDKEQLFIQAKALTSRTAVLDVLKSDRTKEAYRDYQKSIVDSSLSKYGKTADEVFSIKDDAVKDRISYRDNVRSEKKVVSRNRIWNILKGSVQKLKMNLFDYIKDYKDIEKHRKDKAKNRDIPCPEVFGKDPDRFYPKSISDRSYKVGKGYSKDKGRGMDF